VVKQSISKVLEGGFKIDDRVEVAGWVRTRRDSKAGLSFIHLSDGSCFDALQLVAPATLPNYESDVSKLTTGCSLRAVGKLAASQGKGQSVELQVEELVVTGWVEDPEHYPLAPKRHSNEFLREIAHLRPRTNTFGAVARVRHALSQAIHRFFHERGFIWVHTPIITASDCEGAGEMFRVSTLDKANRPGEPEKHRDFFGQPTFLTVSGQLAVENFAQAFVDVYTFGPTFRAEQSHTPRHAAEFWMIEPEIAFGDLDDVIALAESFVKEVAGATIRDCADDFAFFDQRIEKGVTATVLDTIGKPFARLTWHEAQQILVGVKRDWEFPVGPGSSLQSEHERFLAEEYFHGPVFVTNYPASQKSFYMRLDDALTEGEQTVSATDLLVPGIGEIIGGSQREERLDVLDARIRAFGLDPDVYWWYRDLRRYGTTPHGGFGLGLERLLMWMTGMKNIRDVLPYPRTPGHAEF
jgi:asparaginyl-tRNA synthetase